ncbi:hypothetical protein PWP93_28185 [Paraburkholderia sp. A1RI-2L]|uniref:hypothetical protein n=1 Tax=Paraburkholderia sp. A1RI-2L TaxID=3028367 RepID=UPI003B7DE4F6
MRERHYLTADGWTSRDEHEHSTVKSAFIADITRASIAARTLARMLHNSLSEPDATGGRSLGAGVHDDFADAIYCLNDYIFERTNEMREVAERFEDYKRTQGGHHA